MAADIFLSAVSKTQTARHPVMTRYVSESVHPGTVGRGESYTLASLTCLSSVILGCLRVQEGCIEFRDGTTVLFKELTVISKLSPTDPEQVRDICRQNCEGLSKSCVRFTEAYGSDEPISFAHLDPDIFAHYYCQNFSSSVGLNGDLSLNGTRQVLVQILEHIQVLGFEALYCSFDITLSVMLEEPPPTQYRVSCRLGRVS